jgi:hypothetical protein
MFLSFWFNKPMMFCKTLDYLNLFHSEEDPLMSSSLWVLPDIVVVGLLKGWVVGK